MHVTISTFYFHSIDAVTAYVQYSSGKILLDLEEFEAAQRDLQNCFATRKAVYGIKDKRTMNVHLTVVQAARLAGNLQRAKEILETAEDSLLGMINCKVFFNWL